MARYALRADDEFMVLEYTKMSGIKKRIVERRYCDVDMCELKVCEFCVSVISIFETYIYEKFRRKVDISRRYEF